MSVGRGLFAVALTASAAFTAASCSSENEIGEITHEEDFEFPIYIKGFDQEMTTTGNAKIARALQKTMGKEADITQVPWIPTAVEEILPEGFNPLAAELENAENEDEISGIYRTQYRLDGGAKGGLVVLWKQEDKIGIKTVENALSGSAEWTKMDLTSGAGNKVADFMGLANTVNGLQPTGTQNITAIYPFSADGNYDISTQGGTLGTVGDFDIRTDNGELTDSYVRDVYLTTIACILRIDKMFFDNGTETKTKGNTEATITVRGAGIGNRLTGVCTNGETITEGSITATVALDQYCGKPVEDVYLSFLPIDTTKAEFTVEVQCGSNTLTYSRYQFYKSHFVPGTMYNLRHPSDDVSELCMDFVDDEVEAILIQNFDQDKNGCISYREARAITTLGSIFQRTGIERFPELQYFTGLKKISNFAFCECIKLKEIILPEQVTEIGDYAFMCAFTLDTINFHNIEKIGNEVFKSCSNLTTVYAPQATSIGYQAFSSCSSLTTVYAPQVTNIDDQAFSYCDALTTIELPQATNIGDQTFYYCIELTTIELPQATNIGSSTFWNCRRLTTVYAPQVTSIENGAFINCNSLETLTVKTGCSFSGANIPSTTNIIYVD